MGLKCLRSDFPGFFLGNKWFGENEPSTTVANLAGGIDGCPKLVKAFLSAIQQWLTDQKQNTTYKNMIKQAKNETESKKTDKETDRQTGQQKEVK